MAHAPAVSTRVDVNLNLSALRLVDPDLKILHDHATHVVIYSFKQDTNEWEKINIEGVLFIYSRHGEPLFNMTVINRLNTKNFIEGLSSEMNLQVNDPFLLYKNGAGRIFGIWFYNYAECAKIANTLEKLIKEMIDIESKNGMMSLLSVSEGSKPLNDIKVLDGTSKRVLDFFAMAKNTTPCQPPGGNQRPPGISPQRSEPINKPQSAVKPLLQRLLSNPNQPVKTVEQIEKQHMSTTPKKESAPIDIVKASPGERNQQRPLSLIVSNSSSSVEKKLENGFGFVRISESRSPHSISPSGVEPLDQPGSSGVETPGKLPLFTPNMFMTSCNEPEPQDMSADIDLDIRPEPLTKAQLLQAVSYLLKNDPDFVNKLHEAYVKSFVDRVS